MSHTVSKTDGAPEYHFAHHFESAAHEFDAAKQGMWLFLVQEVLFFGGLFVAYTIFRGLYPAAFSEGHHLLDWRMGMLNTFVLITSSWTMLRAVTSAQRGEKKKIVYFLTLTLICAGIFLVVKYFEYTHKFHAGLLPGKHFAPVAAELHGHPMPQDPKTPLFFSLYFMMTGVHGAHVIGGMVVMVWWLKRALRGEFNEKYYFPLEMLGLYWHFVDLIWIYLFPLLYLVG